MFGYVVMNKPEIKFKDFDLYRSFYCGLCRELREKYGISGQITLTYDLTFVIILLSGLYEPPVQKGTTRCVIHPVRKQPVRKNAITEYAADMNVFLAYYKCVDNWKDDRNPLSLMFGRILKNKDRHIEKRFEKKTKIITELLDELSQMEKAGEKDVDRVAGCFGKIMEEIFVYREDVWESTLRRMGFFLGKFIYLMDAYDDVEKDVEKGNYNPFAEEYMIEGFQEKVQHLLMMMMSEACREFEKLPIIKYTDILRNILYSGVWCRFETVNSRRKEKQEKEHV